MALNEAPLLFRFEVDSSENLTFIPMCVRFNLDRFGLRISLAQWQLLPYEDRRLLACFPVDEDTQIEPNFDHALFEMIRTHANVEPDWFAPEEAPAWRDVSAVPVHPQLDGAGLAFGFEGIRRRDRRPGWGTGWCGQAGNSISACAARHRSAAGGRRGRAARGRF